MFWVAESTVSLIYKKGLLALYLITTLLTLQCPKMTDSWVWGCSKQCSPFLLEGPCLQKILLQVTQANPSHGTWRAEPWIPLQPGCSPVVSTCSETAIHLLKETPSSNPATRKYAISTRKTACTFSIQGILVTANKKMLSQILVLWDIVQKTEL